MGADRGGRGLGCPHPPRWPVIETPAHPAWAERAVDGRGPVAVLLALMALRLVDQEWAWMALHDLLRRVRPGLPPVPWLVLMTRNVALGYRGA